MCKLFNFNGLDPLAVSDSEWIFTLWFPGHLGGLLEWGIIPAEGFFLYRKINCGKTNTHPFVERDSKLQSQYQSSKVQYTLQNIMFLWSVMSYLRLYTNISKISFIDNTDNFRFKHCVWVQQLCLTYMDHNLLVILVGFVDAEYRI